MADWSPYYNTGTASISNGSTTVTGQSSSWSTAGLRAGDLFGAAGIWVPIASINSNTSITLARSWPGSSRTTDYYDIQRVSDADRLISAHADLMASLVPNLTALGGLTLATNKLPYATGAGAMALTDLTAVARTLLAQTSQATMRTAGLGAGAIGAAAFQSSNLGAFLEGTVSLAFPNVADDAAVVIPLLTGGGKSGLVLWSMGTIAQPAGILHVRTSATGNGVVHLASTGVAPALTTGVLTGTTGADGVSTFSAGADGNLYYENRVGNGRPLFVHRLFTGI